MDFSRLPNLRDQEQRFEFCPRLRRKTGTIEHGSNCRAAAETAHGDRFGDTP